jgi:hypothetical protein
MSFPHDDYTPHGYLDLPGHTRNLTPQGVLRSHGAGFRWHFPAYGASYGGRRETYRAGLRLSVNGTLEPQITCTYHSKNLFRYRLEADGAVAHAEFHTVGSDVLRAVVTLEVGASVRLGAHVTYTRTVSANGEWGESGLLARLEDELLVIQSFEDGDAFALSASTPWTDAGVSADALEAERWALEPGVMPESGLAHALGRRGETVTLHGVLGFQMGAGSTVELLLSRGRTLPKARASLGMARERGDLERAALLAADEMFWARAPRLTGDWPAHWRRGVVYDAETLRMMVKQPVGAYRHVWDAMQIQAPRVVLAEAAMDALLLGYADPATAQAMLLGVFADADAPNVPCSREDGSYNMVAADGTVCGTAPEWGYPFAVVETLYPLHPDRAWLGHMFEHLSAYFNWWLEHRTDADGWAFYACSWESGQDDSPRFGAQPLGGGHPVRHVRPVDLHASLAHAAGVMTRLSGVLGLSAARWRALEERYTRLTNSLWNGERYADFDANAQTFTDVDDPMLRAPFALGVADAGKLEAGRALVGAHPEHPHEWPMLAWTVIEAARKLGMLEREASFAHAIAERAYSFWDAREAREDRTLPGITAEYWPAHGRCGGEGYGWGAFAVHFVLYNLVGYAPTADGLHLRPNLPTGWRAPGKTYRLHLHHHGSPLEIVLEPQADGVLEIAVNRVRRTLRWGETLSLNDAEVSA